MTISTRTPEGLPSHCVLCGADVRLEFSDPAGDAPCPNCGYLLWYSADLWMSVRHRLSESLDVPEDEITVDTPLAEFADDSPRLVEYVMEIEEEFDLSLSEEEVQKIQTVGDVIRLIEARKRGSGG